MTLLIRIEPFVHDGYPFDAKTETLLIYKRCVELLRLDNLTNHFVETLGPHRNLGIQCRAISCRSNPLRWSPDGRRWCSQHHGSSEGKWCIEAHASCHGTFVLGYREGNTIVINEVPWPNLALPDLDRLWVDLMKEFSLDYGIIDLI